MIVNIRQRQQPARTGRDRGAIERQPEALPQAAFETDRIVAQVRIAPDLPDRAGAHGLDLAARQIGAPAVAAEVQPVVFAPARIAPTSAAISWS